MITAFEAVTGVKLNYHIGDRRPGDIENRVMAQLEREEEQAGLRAEVAALRADVAAMRAEMAELKHILLARRDTPSAPPITATENTTRGKQLLPYARPEKALAILS